jgi:acyl-CoA reductase-like NAD-dependent aldehyde dehydrogenase
MLDDFKLLIGGKLVDGDGSMDVINPATEKSISRCPRASKEQFDLAVRAAKAAYPGWGATPIPTRQKILSAIADQIETNRENMARLLTLEQGKPLSEATLEVDITAAFFRYAAERSYDTKVLVDKDSQKVELLRRPLGVVAAIIPWNFPLMILAFKMPLAMLTGNTLVVKPAATTPLATLFFAQLIANVVPPGVVNVVTDANDLGDVLTSHPDVAKVGMKVMANAAKTMKRFSLELGGNDAGIVLDDVDPAAIAPAIFKGAFFNNGQVCLALKRLYVHESKYEAICAELAKLADAALVGDGLEQGTAIGPLQNAVQYDKVKGYLEDARENGRIVAGGEVLDGPGYFVKPTIVADIVEGARLVDEEQFGPILPVLKFKTVDEAVRRANATSYGLGASVWSSDRSRAREIALRLEAGTVWINQHIDLAPNIPQAGTKRSGMGVEIGEEGMLEYTQVQVLNEAI